MNEQDLADYLKASMLLAVQALEAQPADVQAHVAAGLAKGGELEVRIRLRPAMVPRLSLHLFGDRGGIEIVSTP